MRILKFILVAIAGLVILFFAFGMVKSSVSYGHTITVNKSVEEAWAVTMDESKYDQWLEGFQSIELIEGEPEKPGSKYKVVVDPGEEQEAFEMIETVVSIEEFEHVEMHFDSEFMNFEQVMTFSESDNQTTISTDSKVIGKNILMRSMFAIMETFVGSFTTQERKNIENLKKVIETNTTNYYPDPIESVTEESATELKSE